MTRTAIVCPIVAGIELADYLGWVFHRECDGIRPLFCPADQALRLQRCAVRSPPVARDFCDSNMFGGEDLIRKLALAGKRAAQPVRASGRLVGGPCGPLVERRI